MKIVVIGGSGAIGARVVGQLESEGHHVVAASPRTGVDLISGAGLAEALSGAEVVIDVSNAPQTGGLSPLAFYETASRNLAEAVAVARPKHHVLLSVVGTDRLVGAEYFAAKLLQEQRVIEGAAPWTILRATQFFEFGQAIAEGGAEGSFIRLPAADIQPIAAAEVAAAVAELATSEPRGRRIELGGPEILTFAEFAQKVLYAGGDHRHVIGDPQETYFGVPLETGSLLPDKPWRVGMQTLANWLSARAGEG